MANVCSSAQDSIPQAVSHAWKGSALIGILLVSPAIAAEIPTNRQIEFRAAGVVSLSWPEEKSADKAFNFEAFVKGNRWLIRTEPFELLTNKSSSIMESYQAGTDGTNIYSVGLYNAAYDQSRGQEAVLVKLRAMEARLAESGANPEGLREIRDHIASISRQLLSAKPQPKPLNQAVGEIRAGLIPMFSESDLIAPIWLALCSHYVIGHSTTNQVPGLFRPAAASASPDSAVFVHAEVKTSVHFPHLPEFIGFSNDAVLLGRNAASSTQGDRLGAVWNHPLEATYESTVQVYGELALPSAFEIKKYSPSTPNEKAHLRYVIAGRVAEVSASVHLSDFLPHVPVVIAVSDYRHVGDLPSSINIFTRQGQWPSVEAVRATKEYSEVRKRVVSGQSKHGLTRTTILFSLAALSIPLGVLVWKMKLQKAK